MSQTIAERAVTNPASTLTGAELVPVSQGGSGVVATMEQIAALFGLTAGVKVYRALLAQSGTDNPTAIVLENTLSGTPVWTRDGVGTFVATLAGAFTADKTFIGKPQVDNQLVANEESKMEAGWTSADSLLFSNQNGAGDTVDSLGRAYIEILVFP